MDTRFWILFALAIVPPLAFSIMVIVVKPRRTASLFWRLVIGIVIFEVAAILYLASHSLWGLIVFNLSLGVMGLWVNLKRVRGHLIVDDFFKKVDQCDMFTARDLTRLLISISESYPDVRVLVAAGSENTIYLRLNNRPVGEMLAHCKAGEALSGIYLDFPRNRKAVLTDYWLLVFRSIGGEPQIVKPIHDEMR